MKTLTSILSVSILIFGLATSAYADQLLRDNNGNLYRLDSNGNLHRMQRESSSNRNPYADDVANAFGRMGNNQTNPMPNLRQSIPPSYSTPRSPNTNQGTYETWLKNRYENPVFRDLH